MERQSFPDVLWGGILEANEGTPFGRYRLIERLGRGGMGEVWRAHDTRTNRVVAIKVLHPQYSDDPQFQLRFRREAYSAARIENPHVIPIHDYGEIDGRLYVDMRLIRGQDLHTVLASGPIEPSRAVRIVEQVAKALHAAHRVGLVHRDVKPSNILLDDDDFAYLIDFGIAQAAEDTRMTRTGWVGTLLYMAPERLGDQEADARADIYALACVLYECLTGQPPFANTSIPSLLSAHLNTPPPQPSVIRPNVPEQFDPVIATGMAKNPAQRYATTFELARAAQNAVTVPTAQADTIAANPGIATHLAPRNDAPARPAAGASELASGNTSPTQIDPKHAAAPTTAADASVDPNAGVPLQKSAASRPAELAPVSDRPASDPAPPARAPNAAGITPDLDQQLGIAPQRPREFPPLDGGSGQPGAHSSTRPSPIRHPRPSGSGIAVIVISVLITLALAIFVLVMNYTHTKHPSGSSPSTNNNSKPHYSADRGKYLANTAEINSAMDATRMRDTGGLVLVNNSSNY